MKILKKTFRPNFIKLIENHIKKSTNNSSPKQLEEPRDLNIKSNSNPVKTNDKEICKKDRRRRRRRRVGVKLLRSRRP